MPLPMNEPSPNRSWYTSTDGAGVGVDARLAAEEAGVARAARPRQADADARLQDAVARHHPPGGARRQPGG
jgi:hypothetical protein